MLRDWWNLLTEAPKFEPSGYEWLLRDRPKPGEPVYDATELLGNDSQKANKQELIIQIRPGQYRLTVERL